MTKLSGLLSLMQDEHVMGDFKRIMSEINQMMGEKVPMSLIELIERHAIGVGTHTPISRSMITEHLAEKVRTWVIHGYTYDQIEIMLPAYADGIISGAEFLNQVAGYNQVAG